MSAAVLFGFFLALAVCTGQHEKCDVFPKDPVIRMGSDIEIMFRGSHHSLCTNVTSYSPSKITWTLNNKKIDEKFYAVINSTIPAVSIRNFILQTGRVMCHMDVDGKDIILGATTIKAFFPPVKPTNISCVTILEESFTCYWNSGHKTQLPTNYTVFREGKIVKDTCTSESSPCIFPSDLWSNQKISVRAENAVGVAHSDIVELNSVETVKLRPPEHVHVTPYLNRLIVKWERPMDTEYFNVTCEVLYRYQRQGTWIELVESIKMGDVNEEGVADIKVEQLCARYNVSVRCRFQEALWGDWSQSTPVFSSLDVNDIKFHFWRKIFTPDEKGQRRVLLMWKGVPSSCTVIDGYRITIMNLKNNSCPMKSCTMLLKTSSSRLNVTLGTEEYKITIAAYKNISTFSEDSITVPAAGEDCPSLKEVNTVANDNQITVNWTAPSRPAVRYVIDWSAGNDYIRWHFSETTQFALKGEPQKLYRIAVTPLYENCTGQETMLLAYSKEGAPGDIPLVEVSDVRESSACISWIPVPQDKCCGFVRNYTVFYAPDKGTAMDVTVNSSVHEVCLDRLQYSTVYTVSVMARSNGGQSLNNSTTFRTSSNGRSFSRVLIGGLGLILFVVIGTLCFFMVNKYVMKVPSPQFSTLVPWPEQLYQKDKNVSKLLIPECSENISHSLVIFPISFDLDIDGISSTSGEDDCAKLPGSLTKQSDSSTELRITTPPPADLLGVHRSPIATAERVNAGEVPHDQGSGDQTSIGPCCKSFVGKKECLSKERSPEKDGERQPFLQSQGNVPQAYVTMDLFD
ncbi:interleukin-6 receptor subunit beta-like isoform X1 [Scleropages formosus]|uniref:Interleukin-6 receptor subunit beta-like n=1 Tax=Scleropages formosus TaxID=113540 RepID=A0A8C9RDA5_SCLFO|nr:interleukin-6 receptor subunit beta-like isoform X1 [Scleropages formosus]